jgi:uncharacterized repeat protein (TIGR01451 family)
MNILRQLWRWFGGGRTTRKRAVPAPAPRTPVLEVLEERTACAVIGSQIPPSSLNGFVYCDMNVNGIRDAGDTGIAGVPIILLRGSRVVAATLTGLDGSYHFNHLQSGTYTIIQGPIPPSTTMLFSEGFDGLGTIRGASHRNWGSAPQDDTFRNIRLGHAQTGSNYNFGEFCTAAQPGIGILKLVDGVHATVSPGVNEKGNPTRMVVFTFEVPNTGNVPLFNVVVTDTFSDNNIPADSGTFTYSNPLLNPGQVWIFSVSRPLIFPTHPPTTVIVHDVVTVTGTAPNGSTVTAFDQGFYNNS